MYEYLESLTLPDIPTVICGDTHVDILCENLLTLNYYIAVNLNGFEICGKEPTRITDHSKICLDHFIVQNIPSRDIQVLEHKNFTDHSPVVLVWKYNENFTKSIGLGMSLFKSSSLSEVS